MAKLVTTDLTNLTSEVSAVAAINGNFALIETALENTLSRDGTSPNAMSASLDMNSNRILNLPYPSNDTDPVRRTDLDTLVELANAPSFYVQNTAPTGDDIVETAIWIDLDSTDADVYTWNGSSWVDTTLNLKGPTGATGPQGPAGAGTGDVLGPASSTDSAIALFDGTSGTQLKDSTYTVTAFAATLLDDANAGAARTTLDALQSSTFASTARAYTGAQGFTEATLTDAANIDWNLDTAQCAKVTLGGNRTMNAPTNLRAGFTYILRVIQDGTGTRTLAFSNAIFKFPAGTEPVVASGANDVSILTFYSDGTSLYGVGQLDFS